MRTTVALIAAAGQLWLCAAASAAALTEVSQRVPTDADELVSPTTLDARPPGHRRTARQVLATADRQAKVHETLRRHRGATRYAYMKGSTRWQVSYFERQRRGQEAVDRREIAQVIIDDRSGAAVEVWTGHQVAWTMARGYPGAFGRRAAALYVWIPLLVAFLVGLADRRRLRSWRNLDLLALASFSVSLAFFSHGHIGVSVPLAYPPLAYLLVRMLVAAASRARRAPGGETDSSPLRLGVPVSWLAIALIFLIGFRVGLNLLNSNVIDVGYAGVIGADRLIDGKPIYGDFPADNDHGDTYGPVVYYAYVPFEQIWPWEGRWDELRAAHGAAVAFDLLTILLLWLLGRRLRGPTLGIALAFGWAAFPFTLFTASSNSNDALVSALLVAMLLAAASPPARGALAALAGLTKFAPLALAPLLALYRPPDARHGRARSVVTFTAAFAVTGAAAMAPVITSGDLGVFYERTLGYQGERDSPFSIWGIVGGLDDVQLGMQLAAIVLALVVAVVPRRRDVVSLSALSAAVLIAVQFGVTHWFYLYIVWFTPLVLVVALCENLPPRWRRGAIPEPGLEAGSSRSRPPAAVATP